MEWKTGEHSSGIAMTLLQKIRMGDATEADFEKYWKIEVPHIFNPTLPFCHNSKKRKDELLKQNLLEPLEDFLSKFKYPNLIQRLNSSQNVPPLCRKLFQQGEPLYSCRECSMDSKCVLCVDCFINSIHKHHKYRMAISEGGGCCDCGDEEAWKNGPLCDLHKISTLYLDPLPVDDDFMDRVRLIFSLILHYSFDVLNDDNLNPTSKWIECENNSLNYCTVLYNDKVLSFEESVNCLSRILNCSAKDAKGYVTNAHREGRTIIKCTSFNECTSLKVRIELYTTVKHGNIALKVAVIQSVLVAHQTFAVKLLDWLLSLLNPSLRLRNLFTEIAAINKGETGLSLLDQVLLRDIYLWKSARLSWHHLFITGMLMDYGNKRIFATAFARNYNEIAKKFIFDNYDDSFSAISFSPQIFCIPSIAHYLIETEDILFNVMKVFVSEFSKRCRRMDKLDFDRITLRGKFHRIAYSLNDVSYLLEAVPRELSHPLRKGFFAGFNAVTQFLSCMQGMNSFTRQIGQHLEYDPEWQSPFSLYLRMAPTINFLLKWCTSDHYMLARSYKHILKLLYEDYCSGKHHTHEVTVSNFTSTVIAYDAVTQPVSIYLPLNRFLASLTLHLHEFNLKYCDLCSNRISPLELIEPVVCIKAMIAQARAGMWRRNGDALTNQIHLYYDVSSRGEMLDKDIILLQIGASLMTNNEFILSILSKFNLISWAEKDFEKRTIKCSDDDLVKQTSHLVEEFFLLLITVIGERFVPGVGMVTKSDCVKHEVIQKLCIKALSHSELENDIRKHEIPLENIINEVANFKKPSANSAKGVNELKSDFANQYNVFFYHFTKEESSASEEVQRKFNKTSIGLECCPPPKLPPFANMFKNVSTLLTSDLFLYLIKLVLERSQDQADLSVTERQIHEILHLVGYGLNEEEEGSLTESFTAKASREDIPQLLDQLLTNPRVESCKDLVKWIIRKFTILLNNEQMTLSIADSLLSSHENDCRSSLAAERKTQIMAQMAKLQKNFMKGNAHLFELGNGEAKPIVINPQFEYKESADKIALGPNQTQVIIRMASHTCILCQEEQEATSSGSALVFAAFVQQSTVLFKGRKREKDEIAVGKHDIFSTQNTFPGIYSSTCGHVMHKVCWDRYFLSAASIETQRNFQSQYSPFFDINKREYLCPLCRCIINTIVPIIPMLASLSNLKTEDGLLKTSFIDWITSLKQPSKEDIVVSEPKCLKSSLSNDLIDMVLLYSNSINVISGLSNYADVNLTGAWQSCAYTIQTIEKYIRENNLPLFGSISWRQKYCLETLVRLSGVVAYAWKDKLIIIQEATKLLNEIVRDQNGCSIFDVDCFSLLIQLTCSLHGNFSFSALPDPISANLERQHLFLLLFYCTIAQIISTMKFTHSDSENELISEFDDTFFLTKCVNMINTGKYTNSDEIWLHVKKEAMPYLRCCSLFFHFLTDVPPPSELEVYGGDTFENLCSYLGVSFKCSELLNNDFLTLFTVWANQNRDSDKQELKSLTNLSSVRLISLPEDYSDLVNSASLFTCPNSGRGDFRTATMCLVCGDLLCSQSYCCGAELNGVLVGTCNFHAYNCGAGVSIFLRIEECRILLLSCFGRGAFIPAPYLNEFGEIDYGLKRGYPLKLSHERYDKLNSMWLSHALFEEISRAFELPQHRSLDAQWQHF